MGIPYSLVPLKSYRLSEIGISAEEAKAEIKAGQSISLNLPEHRVVSLALVTTVTPITVGIASEPVVRLNGFEYIYHLLFVALIQMDRSPNVSVENSFAMSSSKTIRSAAVIVNSL